MFYDPIGGSRIGAVWDPSLKQTRPFRVLGGFSNTPVVAVCSHIPQCLICRSLMNLQENEKIKDKSLVSLNEAAVLSEIERLGSGLITKIIVHA